MISNLIGALIVGCLLLFSTVGAQTQNCEYLVTSEWNTGLIGVVRITNNTSFTISGWSVNWAYDANQLAGSWNADISGTVCDAGPD